VVGDAATRRRSRIALGAVLGAALLAFPWVFEKPYPRDVMIRIFL
jgi:hypothetical protein